MQPRDQRPGRVRRGDRRVAETGRLSQAETARLGATRLTYDAGMRVALLAFAVAAAGCHAAAPTGTACNGRDALCDRAYDQVAFPGTHNAYSTVDENFGAPDQTHTMTRQLDDGVRVLHLEIQAFDDDLYLCHSVCQIGNKLLVDGFTEIAKWVDAHPRDVVTLLMETTGVSADEVADRLERAHLYRRLHAQIPGAPWPTLRQLIDGGDRVVAFLAAPVPTIGATPPKLLDRWSWTWETPWNNQTLDDFSRCDADRGDMGNAIYVVDTYLEDEIVPTAEHAAMVNYNPFLLDRLQHCQGATGRLPNFVMVNYYEVGDLFADVDVLNGFAPAAPGAVDGGAAD
jgi:hypothetical protein